MAYTENAQIVSEVGATTFAATDVYKFVALDGSGNVTIPTTTGTLLPYGVLYGATATTSAGEAVPVAIGGIVKVRMAASTLAAGDFISASTAGFGIAPSTTVGAYVAGQITSGSSGDIRVVSVKLFSGPLGTV